MNDLNVQPAAGVSTPGLSQGQRIANTFSAPSKTFLDIKDGHRSWWMPFVMITVMGYILFAVVNLKIGMETVTENQIRLDPKAEARMANIPSEQRSGAMKLSVEITEGFFIGGPVIVLLVLAAGSLALWGTINFGFGGKASYSSVFAVWMYATLPSLIKTALGIIVIFAGTAPESFNIKNFAPTNAAAFLNPLDTNKALYALLSSLDGVTIWSLILLGMGVAIVAGVKRSSGYIAVFGWWAILVLIGVGWAAAMG